MGIHFKAFRVFFSEEGPEKAPPHFFTSHPRGEIQEVSHDEPS